MLFQLQPIVMLQLESKCNIHNRRFKILIKFVYHTTNFYHKRSMFIDAKLVFEKCMYEKCMKRDFLSKYKVWYVRLFQISSRLWIMNLLYQSGSKQRPNLIFSHNKNKAGYTPTPVACGWAGAVSEVTWSFGQEQWGQRPEKLQKKVKCDGRTDRRTDKAGCRVA